MNNAIQTQQQYTPATTNEMVFNPEAMQAMQSIATTMSKATITVGKHLQGKPADCLAIVMQAAQWKMNPYAVAQKTHLVNGNLGYESQLVNAVISSSRAINGRFKYRFLNWDGKATDKSAVQVGAVLAGEQEITWGEPLYPSQVTTKNSPLWKTNPKQQASYLAVKYWARLYCPDVILGVYTQDELIDSAPRDVTPTSAEIKRAHNVINDLLQKPHEPAKPKQQAQPEPEPAIEAEAKPELLPLPEELESIVQERISDILKQKDQSELKACFAEHWHWAKSLQDAEHQRTACYELQETYEAMKNSL